MKIDSEDLRKYVNYICVNDNDVMTKNSIMHIIELVEEEVKNVERIHKEHPELYHEDGEV